jgi:putative endonuclease
VFSLVGLKIFVVSSETLALGLLGERIAAKWLRARGWRVLEHRFRNGHRDLDLVVQRGSTVAFVEVKTRSDLSFGGPVSAVDFNKLQQMRRSALVWMARHGQSGLEYRIDVVGVWITGNSVKITHVENAHVFHCDG